MKKLLLFLLVIALIPLSGCNSGKNGSSSAGDGSSPVVMRKWSNDALKLTLYFPESATLSTRPDDNTLFSMQGPDDLEITLKEVEPISEREADFQNGMEASFNDLQSYTNDFKELDRKLYQAGDHPAAYIEYLWNVMKSNFRVMALDIMIGEHQYQLAAEFLNKDEVKYYAIARAVLDSVRALKGTPNLDSLKAEKIDATAQVKPEFTLYLTDKTCIEDGIENLMITSAPKGYSIADWVILKEQFGDKLPDALRDVLGNEKAAWVSYNGDEFYQNNRHYFIQRFDEGKPDSFGDQDSLGTIYLGSWYGIDIQVLAYKCTWK